RRSACPSVGLPPQLRIDWPIAQLRVPRERVKPQVHFPCVPLRLDWQRGAESNWRAVPLEGLPPPSAEYPSIRQFHEQGGQPLPSSNRQARSRFHRDLHKGSPCC